MTTADVTLDGSLGPGGALSGPDYAITADLGRQIGSNLFHSFARFNIDTGESATFSGPHFIDNILGRVTGGSASTIDGLLRSTIPEANLFLMNPAGVTFGPNASLDVQGAFHATTADFIRLADGSRFEATPSSADGLLSTAPPEAFGFLDDTPAPITVDHSRLTGEEGETLSLIGGDIRMRGGTLSTPSGRINLASVASAGLAVLADDDLQMRSLHGGEEIEQGKISLSQGSRVEVSGSGAGIFIRGGRFTLKGDSEIKTLTTSADEGGDISVKATDAISVDKSSIQTETLGDGKAGDIALKARTIKLDGSGSRPTEVSSENARFDDEGNVAASGQGDTGTINLSAAEWVSMSKSSIGTSTGSSGTAGDISLETGSLELMDFSFISSGIFGNGNVGALTIKATDTIKMSSFSAISTSIIGASDAGNISIEAGGLELMEGASIVSESQIFEEATVGNAGNIDIKVRDTIKMSSFSAISTSTKSAGDAGNISIEAGGLELTEDARILSESLNFGEATGNAGDAGNIDIKATDTIKMSSFSAISTSIIGASDAGNISIEAGGLELTEDARILSESLNFGEATGNAGNAGNIDIKVRDTIKMSSVFTEISTSIQDAGDAGNISMEAGGLVMDDAVISSTSFLLSDDEGNVFGNANAGNIDIKARDTIKMSNSSISTTTISNGDAGTISIEADSLELRGRTFIAKDGEEFIFSSLISSESLGNRSDAGESGRIFIRARDSLRLFDGSRVSVETARADAGDITLEVGDLLELRNGSSITTSVGGISGISFSPSSEGGFTITISPVAGAQGDGGNIRIDPVFVVLDEGSGIVTNAREGRGGNIFIRIVGGGALFQSLDSLIEASSELGIDGSVVIDAPDTDLTGGLVALPANFLDAAAILPQACTERLGSEVSRLVVRHYEVLPDSPYALRVRLPNAPDAFGERRATRTWDQPPSDEVYSVLGDAAPQPLSGRLGCSL